MRTSDYVDWSIKAVYYAGGVASTVVGSWLTSKIRLYHDARNSHRDDLKAKVLERLRENISLYFANPRFNVLHQSQAHNPDALSGEYPNTYGPTVTLQRLGDRIDVDEVLLEDARHHHYRSILASWDAFVREWEEQAAKHKEFILAVANEILGASNLTAFPTATFSGPYIMHWYIGNFIHSRLVLDAETRLEIQPQSDSFIITDNHVTAAKGTEGAMKNVIQWVDGIMIARREQVKGLREGLAKLNNQRSALSRQLNLAIAEKKLRQRCSLVKFV
jgi:hypothetical protein